MSTYAIDCDGTFMRYPSLFAELGSALRAAGHTVVILTGNRRETMLERAVREPLLLRQGWYDQMITWDAATDEEKANLAVMSARAAVGIFKRRVCAERKIAALFDDDVEHVRREGAVPVFGVA